MKKLAIPLISMALVASAVNADQVTEPKNPSPSLKAAIAQVKKLDGADFTALKSWMKGDGRQALRDRGITDNDIGGMRLDTDRWGDAPLGK